MNTEFEAFAKIPRLSRDVVVSEKIDGTNAQVYITQSLPESSAEFLPDIPWVATLPGDADNSFRIAAGSRNRWITPEDDNYGFAKWVKANAEELLKLGPGRHFGEYWGAGIQRRYGLTEKRFSLFNVHRWVYPGQPLSDKQQVVPSCCHIVPVLYCGEFDTAKIQAVLTFLGATGSVAAPGFMDPEGIIIYHTAAKQLFKKTIKDDAKGKTE